MRNLLVFILLFISIHPSKAQEDTSRDFFAQGMRPGFAADLTRFPDIPQYTFRLELIPDFTQATITGTLELNYTNLTPDTLNDLVFRLYANLESFGGAAVINNIVINGIEINPLYDETQSVVTLPLPQPLVPGEKITLTLDYEAVVFHGEQRLYNQFSYLETELALASFLPLLSVYASETGWWRETQHPRGDAVYSQTANFDVTLSAPSYLKVIASGSLVEETIGEATNIYRYAAPLMRDFSLMASAQYATLSRDFEDIQVHVHYLPSHQEEAHLAMQWTLDSLAAFTETYGAYVYQELDVVETYTSAGGIEYPGLIVVAANLWRVDEFYFEVVTVHEVAHQWWYSMVGNDQTRYPFLDEALTEYSVSLYWEYLAGENGYNAAISAEQARFVDFSGRDMKIGFTPADYNDDTYSRIVYGKGAYFFHTLRLALGDDLFRAAIQRYLSEYRYQLATPFDLQTILEETAGVQLDDLFTEWVGYSN